MKQTDFAICLNRFLTDFLVNKKGCSPKTIDSYRYAFIFLLDYYNETLGIPADQMTIKSLTYERLLGFLGWLQSEKKSGVATRNQRQAAINSFIRFLMYEKPEFLNEYQKILGIPVKKAPKKEISYLKTDGVSALMGHVDVRKANGLRDYVMLMLLYSTGIRVSELVNIRVKDLSLHEPHTLLVHGKGQKSRYVPLMKDSVPIIQDYLKQTGCQSPEKLDEWLFVNHMGRQFTRQGVNYIIKKYGDMARDSSPDLIPDSLSPHKMRHTAAMELVDSGVDLLYIRDLLGHVSVKTTEIYARTDAKLKREAIEAASREIVPPEEAKWDGNDDLKSWLKSFNKR